MEHASEPTRPDRNPPESSPPGIRAWWGGVFCGAVPRRGRAARRPLAAGARPSWTMVVIDPDAARADTGALLRRSARVHRTLERSPDWSRVSLALVCLNGVCVLAWLLDAVHRFSPDARTLIALATGWLAACTAVNTSWIAVRRRRRHLDRRLRVHTELDGETWELVRLLSTCDPADTETADAAHRLLWAVAATAPGDRDVGAVLRQLCSEATGLLQNPAALREGTDRVAAADRGSLRGACLLTGRRLTPDAAAVCRETASPFRRCVREEETEDEWAVATRPDPQARAGRSFAAKLAHLIATVHPPDRAPYSPREISAGVAARTGVTVSATDLRQLAAGERCPSPEVANALTTFFGVPPDYATDDEVTARIDEQLAKLVAWRDARHPALDQYEDQPRATRRRRKPAGPPET
ncbi:helix-turn-helix domain-containing protein [Amycolatopsis rubida]|uniref:Helix-turn-helix transcriptional regulator n=1 Tax=Amycolatopsis rubida TaxID=112413 RepID=A0A1I5X8B0_9PSEU|nr:hypothetical protein SAMN05421854_11089 [Amycolatopsis rubida]